MRNLRLKLMPALAGMSRNCRLSDLRHLLVVPFMVVGLPRCASVVWILVTRLPVARRLYVKGATWSTLRTLGPMTVRKVLQLRAVASLA